MPANLTLKHKTTGTTYKGDGLLTVDSLMRQALGQPQDSENWLCGWYGSIGMALAMGKTWDEINAIFETKTLRPLARQVLEHLSTTYENVSYCRPE